MKMESLECCTTELRKRTSCGGRVIGYHFAGAHNYFDEADYKSGLLADRPIKIRLAMREAVDAGVVLIQTSSDVIGMIVKKGNHPFFSSW